MNEPLAVREAPAGYQVVLESQPVGRASARHVGLKPDLPVIPQEYKCPKGYKQTEVGVIPEDWELKQLRKISPSQSVGLVINPSTYVEDDGTVPMLVGSNITANSINWENARRISDASNKLLPASRLHSGDLVTVRVGEPGITAVVPPELDGCNCASVMIVRKHQGFDSHWLCYVMNSRKGLEQVENVQYGTAQKQFNISDAINFTYATPPLPEQSAIAAALSDVDALLAKLDQLIAKKRDLKQAVMQQLLTGSTRLPGFSGEWEVKRLGDLGATYGGLVGKTKADFGEGAARYITFMNVMTNVVIDCGTFERVRVVSTETQNRAMKGDLFFNGSSETPEEVAMCAVLLEEVQDVYLNSFCFGFRFRDGAEADGIFFAYYLRSREGRELIKSLAQGSTRYNLSKVALLNSSLRLPTLPEQTAIATILSDMDTELATLEARRAKTRDLKQGMMQELLTGRIRLV